MCLTASAISLFLNLLDPQMIVTEPGRITVHATEQTAVWVQTGEDWCTDAPKIDVVAKAE